MTEACQRRNADGTVSLLSGFDYSGPQQHPIPSRERRRLLVLFAAWDTTQARALAASHLTVIVGDQ